MVNLHTCGCVLQTVYALFYITKEGELILPLYPRTRAVASRVHECFQARRHFMRKYTSYRFSSDGAIDIMLCCQQRAAGCGCTPLPDQLRESVSGWHMLVL